MYKMDKLVIFVVLVIAANEVHGRNLMKRQVQSAVTNSTGNNTTPTPRLLTTNECVSACPVTSEYNPICGSNNVLYSNPGRLLCARDCGVDVQMSRPGPCPTPAPVAPAVAA